MNKNEYMEQLSRALETLDEEMAADILEDYEAHFERAMETGRTEEEIIEELGSIDEFVEELKQFTSDSARKNRGKEQQAGNIEGSRSQYTHTGSYRYNHNDSDHYNYEGNQDNNYQNYEGNQDNNYQNYEDNQDNDYQNHEGSTEGDYSSFGEALDKTLKEAFKAVEASTEQLRKCFDKASGKFGEWFERYERTSEREEDYRARQERARRERERVQRERGQERQNREASRERERAQRVREQERQNRQTQRDSARALRERERAQRTREQNMEEERNRNAHVHGAYSYVSPEGGEGEAYMPSCQGSLRKEEQVYNISVAGEHADIQITASPDEDMHYNYRNEGSEGSKSIYYLKKDISNDTLYLTISKNAQVQQKKNHFGILGGIFAESAELSLELQLPDWIECLDVRGNSGEIHMENCDLMEVHMKNVSGDITVEGVKAKISQIESVSGDLDIQNISFGSEEKGMKDISVILASTSGDISASGIYLGAGKLALNSVSGDQELKDCDAGNLRMNSTSGNIEARDINAVELIQIRTISGDIQMDNLDAEKTEVESKSGDIEIRDSNMDSVYTNTISGEVTVTALSTDLLEIKGMSGDIGMENVQSGEIQISVGSGDVSVSGLDAEKIRAISNATGDMSFSGSANVYALKSHSGDIRLEQAGNTEARIESVSGIIEVELQNNGDGFHAKLNTRGDITIEYDSLSLTEAGCGEHRYGLEGSSLEIKSSSGDITISD